MSDEVVVIVIPLEMIEVPAYRPPRGASMMNVVVGHVVCEVSE